MPVGADCSRRASFASASLPSSSPKNFWPGAWLDLIRDAPPRAARHALINPFASPLSGADASAGSPPLGAPRFRDDLLDFDDDDVASTFYFSRCSASA
jgi:hypothetical protein